MEYETSTQLLSMIQPEIFGLLRAVNRLIFMLDELEQLPPSARRATKMVEARAQLEALVSRIKEMEGSLNGGVLAT